MPKIAAQSGCSLRFPFVFLLDFLFGVLDIERNYRFELVRRKKYS